MENSCTYLKWLNTYFPLTSFFQPQFLILAKLSFLVFFNKRNNVHIIKLHPCTNHSFLILKFRLSHKFLRFAVANNQPRSCKLKKRVFWLVISYYFYEMQNCGKKYHLVNFVKWWCKLFLKIMSCLHLNCQYYLISLIYTFGFYLLTLL